MIREEYTIKGIKITINNYEDWEMVAAYGRNDDPVRYSMVDAEYYLSELKVNIENIEEYTEVTFVPNPIIFEQCEVADQYCKQTVMGECFCCGGYICTSCHLLEEWYQWGEQLICHDCIADRDGNDNRVMKHLEKLAGY